MKEPSFWWNLLEDADRYAIDLKRYERPEELVNAVTVQQVHEAFKKYHIPVRTFTVIAAPDGTEFLAVEETPTTAESATKVIGETR